MSERELSDEERAAYEQDWNDLTEKELLAGILAEVQRTNILLSQMAGETPQEDASADASMYECQHCDAVVKAGERERHAESAHKAPPDMVESLFEEV